MALPQPSVDPHPHTCRDTSYAEISSARRFFSIRMIKTRAWSRVMPTERHVSISCAANSWSVICLRRASSSGMGSPGKVEAFTAANCCKSLHEDSVRFFLTGDNRRQLAHVPQRPDVLPLLDAFAFCARLVRSMPLSYHP